jgi:hypothetical protein
VLVLAIEVQQEVHRHDCAGGASFGEPSTVRSSRAIKRHGPAIRKTKKPASRLFIGAWHRRKLICLQRKETLKKTRLQNCSSIIYPRWLARFEVLHSLPTGLT